MRLDLVYLGGRVVLADEARIDPRDPAVSGGQALIETLAVLGAVPQLVDEHFARLRSSEVAVGWPVTPLDDLRRAIDELIAAAGARDAALRILRSPGPMGGVATLLVELRELPVLGRAPLSAAVERGGWAQPAGIDQLKHTGRLARSLLRDRARQAGHLDCILVDADGLALEATAANLVVVKRGRALTPPAGPGVLPGVVRAILIAAGALFEETLSALDLERADEVGLSSSLLGCVGLERIQGRPTALPGARGPAIQRLASILGARVPAHGNPKPGR